MKRIICIILSVIFCLTMCCSAFASNDNEREQMIKIASADILQSDCQILSDINGSQYLQIRMISVRESDNNSSTDEIDEKCYAFYADSDSTIRELYDMVEVAKEKQNRGSGTLNDYMWFYGYSLCISSTLSYTTTVSSGTTYGKVDSVYVQCSVNSGTVLDSISLYYGECGFSINGGWVEHNNEKIISNCSTTYYPSSWPYIIWDADHGSATGASVTATVHRGTSGTQYQYTFYNNVVGDPY